MRLMRLKLALDNNLAAQHAENAKLKRERDKNDKFGKGGGGGGKGGGKGGGADGGGDHDADDDEEIFKIKRPGWIGVMMEEEDDLPLLKRKRCELRRVRERVLGAAGEARVKREEGGGVKMEDLGGEEIGVKVEDGGLVVAVKEEEMEDVGVRVKQEEVAFDSPVRVKREELTFDSPVRAEQGDVMFDIPMRVGHGEMMQQSPVIGRHEKPMFDTHMRIKDEEKMSDLPMDEVPMMGRDEDRIHGAVGEQEGGDAHGLPIKEELVLDEEHHFIATPSASPIVGLGNDNHDAQTTPLNPETSDWGDISSSQFPGIFDDIKLDDPFL